MRCRCLMHWNQPARSGRLAGWRTSMEIEVAAPPPSAARRHAEIVVERAMLRELLAASAEIEDHATAPGKTVAEKIDYAQQRIMAALADTASAGKRAQLVADMLEAHIDRIEQRWSGVTAGLMTGLPDLDWRIPGGNVRGFDHPRRPTRHGQDHAGDEHRRVRCRRRSPGRRARRRCRHRN